MLYKVASKIVLSYLIGEIEKGKVYAFLNQKKWITFLVKKNGDNFDVCKLVTFPKFIKHILNLSHDGLKLFYNKNKLNYGLHYFWQSDKQFAYSIEDYPDSSQKKLSKLTSYIGNNIYYSFKIDKSFPEKIFIEWEKDNLSIKELAKILMKDLSMSAPEFFDRFGDVIFEENNEKDGLSQFKYKNWEVVMENGLKNKDEVTKLLDEVERKCGSLKSNLCYGMVEVKKHLEQSKTLADYFISSDTMRIKAKRADKDFVKTFLHELGHRLWYRFTSSNNKNEVKNKYNEMLVDEKIVSLKKGDILLTKDGYEIEIEGELFSSYRGIVLQKPARKRNINVGDKITLKPIKETAVKQLNGKDYIPDDTSFPTAYSRTSYTEFFAECFSLYLMGELNKKLSKWFETVI